MGQRINLQQTLQTLIGVRSDGKQNVYFQPPESIKMVYPCIVYKRSNGDVKYADNSVHILTHKYDITLITKDPDSNLPDLLLKSFPMISHNTFFVSENLNHDIFTLYY